MSDWDLYGKDKPVDTLIGETLVRVDGMRDGCDRVEFETATGRTFVMYHSQNCCETVQIEDVTGNAEDLVGAPITMARESSNSDNQPSEYAESWTWTLPR